VEDDEISLHQAIASLTCQPAAILGIDAGQLKAGASADICIIDPDVQYDCLPSAFISAGKNSPFGGWLFQHQVSHTLFQGKVVYQREPN
jgi:dihydroorotase